MSADLQSYFEKQFAELDAILVEQASLQERLTELDQQVARRTNKIAQIASTCEDDLEPNSLAGELVRSLRAGGLSAAIRNILMSAKEPLNAPDILRQLKAIGFPLSGYQNVLATLHLTLKRLHKQEEICETSVTGKKAYLWKGTIRPQLAKQIIKPSLVGALGLGRGAQKSTVTARPTIRLKPRTKKDE